MDILEMKKLEPTFLERARKRGWVCPVCGNGKGKDGDGIERWKKNDSYHCFRCGWRGDVIDLFGVAFDIADDAEKFKAFRKYYNIHPEDEIKNNRRQPSMEKTEQTTQTEQSFLEYYNKCLEYATSAECKYRDYFSKRGISQTTQRHFLLGIDPEWRHPGAPENAPTSPRAIIPMSESAYCARDVRENIPREAKTYEKQNVGAVSIFNTAALKCISSDKPILYVTEGPIDAMSVIDVGGTAIALCGAQNGNLLTEYLTNHPNINPYILIMLDNDDAGYDAAKKLKADLQEIGISCKTVAYNTDYNDPNDFLVKDRKAFSNLIASEQAYYESVMMPQSGILDYFRNIEDQEPMFEAKTGFPVLDAIDTNLYGGFHEGLHILGAMSSEGKSTLGVQFSDQVAARNTPVLFFPTEQTKHELAAKSIARETYSLAGNKKITVNEKEMFLARYFYQITDGRRYQYYTDEEKNIIKNAIEKYAEYSKNIIVIDRESVIRVTNGEQKTLSAAFITKTVADYIKCTGKRPMVFVDYLQDLALAEPRMSDKQNTDNTVAELKALATIYHIPVFAISSFNRENYTEPVNMSSFKESGAIEYSSDFLYGLQQHGMDYIEEDKEKHGAAKRKARIAELHEQNELKCKKGEPILMDFKCIKQRNGMKFSVQFEFVSMFGCFKDNVGETDFVPVEEEKVPFEQLSFKTDL